MASFLDAETAGRRLYVARMLGLMPDDPKSWPMDVIDAIIDEAERLADETVRRRVREFHGVVA